MKFFKFWSVVFLMVFCFTSYATQLIGKAMKVEIKKTAAGYTFIRNGQPYFVKGAGGTSETEALKVAGGNSFRTWSTDNGTVHLDRAERLGLTVTMGLDVARE